MKNETLAKILIVDDEANILHFLSRALEKKGYTVYPAANGADAAERLEKVRPDLVIADILLPDVNGVELLRRIKSKDPEVNVILITAHASLDTAISAIRGGASDYLVKPFKVEELCSVVQRALSSKRLVPGAEKRTGDRPFLGSSSAMQEIRRVIQKVAATDATVLITGESGTGKELAARSIHYGSPRQRKPFVSIICAALPESLLESELFGYEKGSFTGALATKMGLMELADGGTFFLDEVGEIPLALQAKLLRVLQEREIRHVGGLHNIPIDIRVIAATAKDLKREIAGGNFRDDLFYRLNVVPIRLPGLRERRDDIPEMLSHYLELHRQKHGLAGDVQIDEEARSFLRNEYSWPGNVRELENFTERSIMLADGNRIGIELVRKLIAPAEQRSTGAAAPEDGGATDLKTKTEAFEKQLIQGVLTETGGNKFQAAKRLQISRQSLQYKIKKYQLEREV
ncbi:MAG: sigma-54-dependent Fis family transcriptional regulator [Candidatus Omnitrophica bacterium]|nr:sigma-54-dependent Fis family transcriptional regulator [Candidatus Omnitrophota bacterium]